jgi:hypothetical protein
MPNVINGTSTGSGGLISTGDDSGILNIQTNETTAITVDASQIVGVGVTPSAWASDNKALQIGGNGAFYAKSAVGATKSFSMMQNAYDATGGFTYISTDFASRYNQVSGQHVWYNAPSGTAGNAITFTQAMTLSSEGYLTVPATPAFAAKQLSNPSISGYVTTVPANLLFSSVSINNRSCYNSANGRFTAPVAGLYYFAWSILVDDSATVNAITSVSLYLNGTNTVYTAYNQNSGSVYIQISQSCVVSLNANDYVNCYVNSGFVHAGSETAFTGYLIG